MLPLAPMTGEGNVSLTPDTSPNDSYQGGSGSSVPQQAMVTPPVITNSAINVAVQPPVDPQHDHREVAWTSQDLDMLFEAGTRVGSEIAALACDPALDPSQADAQRLVYVGPMSVLAADQKHQSRDFELTC